MRDYVQNSDTYHCTPACSKYLARLEPYAINCTGKAIKVVYGKLRDNQTPICMDWSRFAMP